MRWTAIAVLVCGLTLAGCASNTATTPSPTVTLVPTVAPTLAPTLAPTEVPTEAPAATEGPPAGATAKCNDGTYSYAAHHQGACSHHGGVAEFYK